METSHRPLQQPDRIPRGRLPAFTKAIIPICRNHHCIATFLSFQDKTFELSNSLPGFLKNIDQIEQAVLKIARLLKYTLQEIQPTAIRIDQMEGQPSLRIDAAINPNWTEPPVPEQAKQLNRHDWGIFVLDTIQFSELISKRSFHSSSDSFPAADNIVHIPHSRSRDAGENIYVQHNLDSWSALTRAERSL